MTAPWRSVHCDLVSVAVSSVGSLRGNESQGSFGLSVVQSCLVLCCLLIKAVLASTLECCCGGGLLLNNFCGGGLCGNNFGGPSAVTLSYLWRGSQAQG